MMRLWLSMSVVVLAGCGGEPMGRVVGTVTHGGKPVTAGILQFIPGNGPMAAGGLDAAGRFTLTTRSPGDGALAGRHLVVIQPFYPAASDLPEGTPPPNPANIPQRYRTAATTPLTIEVRPGQLNEVVFDLTD